MRILRRILMGLLVIFALLQFIPRTVNKSDQAVSTDFAKIYAIPVEVQSIFQEACYDCHSNNTRYPWYSNIQPFRLWLDLHIQDGKEELNFSNFGAYTSKRRHNKLNSMAKSIKKGTMPLTSYKWMHAKARLEDAQKNLIIQWISDTQDSLQQKK
ncbi:heme-binding domain-containing protein [Sediminibacterium soli]|uniref:heme-binding domain-containing protein n=1 Tax=Sediminibacterium soli TaxID=2698829 RepID=UPI00137A8271|nr:heme-binding domain-containing protein [Sediminibacterium soli]NCI46420.1 heme-binding domain-containing protein [Sediminibacterium soli]